jgi:hypothetical protein
MITVVTVCRIIMAVTGMIVVAQYIVFRVVTGMVVSHSTWPHSA